MMRIIDKMVEVVAIAAFVTSSLFICINVLNRYLVLGLMRNFARDAEWLRPGYLFLRDLFGSISVTADEVPGFLLVWVAFLGAYLTMRRDGHISFDMLADALAPRVRRMVSVLNIVLISGFLLVLLWKSIFMIRISGRTEIETAEIAQGWFMAILPIAAVLLLLALFQRARALMRPGELDREPEARET